MTRTHRILTMLGDRSIFDVAEDAGCTKLQVETLFMAAQGLTDAEIAKQRKVTRYGVGKTRQAACKRILRYLETEVVSA